MLLILSNNTLVNINVQQRKGIYYIVMFKKLGGKKRVSYCQYTALTDHVENRNNVFSRMRINFSFD